MEKNDLYIPTNVSDSNDIISGFGMKELAITGAGAGFALMLAIILYSSSKNIVTAVLLPFTVIAVIIVCVRRDKYSESVIDKLRFIWIYYRSQKRYKYQYYDYISEMMEKDNDNNGCERSRADGKGMGKC